MIWLNLPNLFLLTTSILAGDFLGLRLGADLGSGGVEAGTSTLSVRAWTQGCQMAKFDPFLSLDCARVEGVGAQSKERKGSNFAA